MQMMHVSKHCRLVMSCPNRYQGIAWYCDKHGPTACVSYERLIFVGMSEQNVLLDVFLWTEFSLFALHFACESQAHLKTGSNKTCIKQCWIKECPPLLSQYHCNC